MTITGSFEGRLVKVSKELYVPASRIVGVVKYAESKTTEVRRLNSGGGTETEQIVGNFRRIANKVSRAKTTSGGAINLIPLKTRIIDFLKPLLRK